MTNTLVGQLPNLCLSVVPHIPPSEEPFPWKLGSHLSPSERQEVLDLLDENKDCFAFSLEDLSQCSEPPMDIVIAPEIQSIFQNAHKLSAAEWDFVDANCKKLLSLGFIRQSRQTRYASATVVVRKKDEEGNYTDFRQCGDYRPLNKHTLQDKYPLPNIDDIFIDMVDAKIFSKLDLRQGYHQIPMKEEDKAKTTFWGARRQLYEWNVVPYGLKNAPPFVQRLMEKMMAGCPNARC